MGQEFNKLFKKAVYQPESRLSGDIWHKVLEKRKNELKLKAYGYTSLGLISTILGVFSINNLISRSIQLGFYDYLSLAFSDMKVLAHYWQDYGATLINALPVASLAFTLFLLFVLFISIRRASYQFRNGLALS